MQLRIVLLFLILFPNILHADEGLNLSCMNMLSAFGKKYEPLNYKLEATGFHYFDKKQKKFTIIPSKELEFGEDRFTVKFPKYELGFQRIVYAGDTEPTITMSKYDYKNNKFLDHYECTSEKTYID
tara:strand:+ start:738 stop:1115 length:378 start_codon:yes stop_codon:yes gene_type:complete